MIGFRFVGKDPCGHILAHNLRQILRYRRSLAGRLESLAKVAFAVTNAPGSIRHFCKEKFLPIFSVGKSLTRYSSTSALAPAAFFKLTRRIGNLPSINIRGSARCKSKWAKTFVIFKITPSDKFLHDVSVAFEKACTAGHETHPRVLKPRLKSDSLQAIENRETGDSTKETRDDEARKTCCKRTRQRRGAETIMKKREKLSLSCFLHKL